MKTTLRAGVEVSTITVVAELAVLERRPELARLCQAAVRHGVLDARVVGEELRGLSERACANLLRHCVYLGLCDGEGRLTEVGRGCAERSEAPVPEQGVYTFWVARHPLWGVRLLHFQREQPEPRDLDFQSLRPLPEWLRADRRRVWESVVEGGVRFCLRELLGPPGSAVRCRLASAPACQLTWELDFSTGANGWHLAGKLECREGEQSRPRPFVTSPESVTDLDTGALFAAWEPRWRAEQGVVAMDFDGRVDEGARAFRRSLTYPSVSVPDGGTYEKVEVLDVPVGPSNAVQAQRWADALLREVLKKESGYVAAPRLRALFDALVGPSPLARFPVVLTDVEAHLGAVDGDERLYWMLAAPFDLGPGPGVGGAAGGRGGA